MVGTSSPCRRSGEMRKVAPSSSPTSRGLPGAEAEEAEGLLEEEEDEEERGKMYPDRETWREAVAMGRDSVGRRRRAVGRRELREAIFAVCVDELRKDD